MKFHFPKYWLFLLLFTFVIMSLMPFMTGALVAFIANGEEGRRRFLHFNPYFPTLVFFFSSFFISAIISLILWSRIFLPLGNISQAAKKVAKGDFTVRVQNRNSFRELKELTDNFNRMVQELGSIEALRNDFAANISHEFKTPLAAIEGYATLLQSPALSEQERDEYIRTIMDSTRQLSSMAGNILLISRLEKQEIVTDQSFFQLDELIRQSLLLLEPLWEKKHLDLDINLPGVRFYGKPDLLMQVFLNLFQNAIKFTPAGGTISAVMTTTDASVSIQISDTGIGMDETTLSHIFEKFYCGSKEAERKGNGLGLSITKRIVDLFHGTIQVKSAPGEGASFTIELPVEKTS